MIYFTADWHLGDERLSLMGRDKIYGPYGLCKNAVEFAEMLLRNTRDCISSKSDYLFFNGDICYKPEFLHFLEGLPNCKRCLIRGNHDRQFDDSVLSQYFDKIIPEGEGIELLVSDIRCWITHYPTKSHQYLFNLIGHIHSAWKVQLNMLNVGVDVHQFHPIDEERVRFYFDAIKKFYDDDVWVGNLETNSKYIGVRGKKGRYFNEDTSINNS